MTKFMRSQRIEAVNTMWAEAGPTYYDKDGRGKTIDFIFAPKELHNKIKKCATVEKQTAVVQATPYARDHIALTMVVAIPCRPARLPPHAALDRDKLAIEVQQGTHRVEFLRTVNQTIEAHRDVIE